MSYGAYPNDVLPTVNSLKESAIKTQTLRGQQLDNAQKVTDAVGQQAQMLLSISDPDQRQLEYQSQTVPLMQRLNVPANLIPQTVPDDNWLKGHAASAMRVDQQLDQARKNQEYEQQHGTIDPARLGQMNTLLTNFANVYGQSPNDYLLKPGATWDDYNRVNAAMDRTEKAGATQAQLQMSNQIRNQTFQLHADALADRQAQQALMPVMGTDAGGNQVLTSFSDAQRLGLKNPMKAESADVSKAMAARAWVNDLADKPGIDPRTNPQQAGIKQLIDDLADQGKLGVVTSRWNDFMAGKVGAGDPEVAALRAKMGLSNTLLMNVHVGNRGGSYMTEHFQDLADQGQMDGDTLKSAYGSELDYVRRKQMLPGGGAATAAAPGGGHLHRPLASPASRPVTASCMTSRHRISRRRGRSIPACRWCSNGQRQRRWNRFQRHRRPAGERNISTSSRRY